MLAALSNLADRLEMERILPPPNYKLKKPVWYLNIDSNNLRKSSLEGPYNTKDYSSGLESIYAPDRQRSGKNPPPFLMVDKAEYVFGIFSESGSEGKAKRLHAEYLRLLKEAIDKTGLKSMGAVYSYISNGYFTYLDNFKKIEPEHIIAFRVDGSDPCSEQDAIRFWNHFLEKETSTKTGTCLVCGCNKMLIRKLPREIILMGQKCIISSFNESSYLSFGKQQTENSPMCFLCASKITDALDYLTRDPRAEIHRCEIVRDSKNQLRNIMAVFWLKEREELTVRASGYDKIPVEALLSTPIEGRSFRQSTPLGLSQLEELLNIPWTGKETPLGLDQNRFYLALLSANKARMVLRTWLDTSLNIVISNLRMYVKSVKIIDPYGRDIRAFGINEIVRKLDNEDPKISEKLVLNVYAGISPPASLLAKALKKLKNPNNFHLDSKDNIQKLQTIMAVLKLCLTYDESEEVKTLMERLDYKRDDTAYLCGRLLAILEEAQKRASSTRLNRTLVDSFYASASTSPSPYFGLLVNRSHMSHLRRIRKDYKGYTSLIKLLEDVLSRIDNQGGFPARLDLREQAEFALGFYHQRAEFRSGFEGEQPNRP